MTFKSRTLTASAVIVLLASGAAWAQSTTPAPAGAAPPMDKPAAATPAASDKPMTSKEMSAAFTKADVNKDGKLDKMEAEGIPGLGARFDQVDADGDKLVSKVELEKAMKP
jgi:EF hand